MKEKKWLKPLIIVAVIIALIAAAVKIKKPLRGLIQAQGGVAVILAIAITANVICMGPEYALLNNTFGDQYYLTEGTIADSEQLVKDIANEGIVLLKNDDNALPLADVTKLNVFGWASTNPIYGGTGSGSVDTTTCITLLKGLENAGFELNTTLSDFYTAYETTRPTIGMNGQDWTVPEPSMADYDAAGIFENAKEFSDTAVVVIARSGGEGADLPTSLTDENTFENVGGWKGVHGVRYSSNPEDIDPSKHYLELTGRETAMVERVTSEFDNVIIVVNSANAMELGWLEEYDSINGAVWMAGPGQTGFDSLGKILKGEVNPSGKLVDTFVYDLTTVPAFNWIGDFRYEDSTPLVGTETAAWLYASFNNYVEGIYVGYKYYETAAADGVLDYDATVQYPFGYGLSYTSFEQSIVDVAEADGQVTLTVSVKNTGSVAGKSVVQVYYNPPYTNGGIEKSAVNLVNFEKTAELAPGEETTVTVTFSLEDMASYDYSGVKAAGGAYVLEAGDYVVSINADAHNVIDSRTITVDADIIYNDDNAGKRASDFVTATNQFDFANGGVTYLSRANGFANYAEATAAPTDFVMSDEVKATFYCQNTYDPSVIDDPNAEMPITGAKNGLTIRDMIGVAYDDAQWDQLLDQLTVDEMNSLIALGGYANAKIESIDLPATIECDGLAAIKNNYTGQTGTAFPAATMIAATWSKELALARGEMIGRQCEDMNVCGWYGPAMNIHRTPFSGRNFEYYSEDGVLSGWMGAYEVMGAEKYGVQCYIKHFALNDSEINRKKMLCTWCDEQSMREIYLKPFEMSVKLGGANNAMTAFNYVGNMWAGSCEELLVTVLRGEWGFVGSTVSDWFNGTTDGCMLADSAIRVGGDKMLSSQGDPLAYASNTDQAATVVAMRNAAHKILYSLANSNAMNDRNWATPTWVTNIYMADAVIAILVIAIEAIAILSYKKRSKTAEAK